MGSPTRRSPWSNRVRRQAVQCSPIGNSRPPPFNGTIALVSWLPTSHSVRELGIPAVVAMADRVTVATAGALATAFYRNRRGESPHPSEAVPLRRDHVTWEGDA